MTIAHKFDQSIVSRFWSKVEIGGSNECWPWKAGCFDSGYGAFSLSSKKLVRANRFAFELYNGSLPDGICALHRCDNRPCCNPNHLFAGSNLDNIKDRDAKGRQAKGERAGTSKLSTQQVEMIRSSRLSQRKMAALLGVSKSLIGAIRRSEIWR